MTPGTGATRIDAGLHYGAPRWTPIAFGLATGTAGLSPWHGLGPHFGPGEARGRVDRRAAVVVLLPVVVLIEMLVGSR